jgi:hypothetical protein
MAIEEAPLIWTTKGNLPVESLVYETAWMDAAEFIQFKETYTLDGEIVRESSHVYSKKPLEAVGEQATF